MEEETDVRENLEDNDILSIFDVEIDLDILEAYKKTPKEFQDKLSFESFYNFHRRSIEDKILRQKSEDFVESLADTTNKTEVEIPDEELCKNCGKERKAFDDKDYCLKCVATFREDALKQTEKIKTELLKDSDFLKLTSEEAAKAYVGKKYLNIKNTNKFVAIKTIAKEAYQLKKMQN